MPKSAFADVIRYLHRVCALHGDSALSDRELLGRFAEYRDEDAFTVLVRRHGPMIFGVCRRLLGDSPEAEDALQATFLVLVRRAQSIRRRESLGSWLHSVAQRVALRARAQSATRRRREREAGNMAASRPIDDSTWQELRLALDEEIGALSEKYRAPIILCFLEGKTHAQAARALGCPTTSLTRRLARGRDLLRVRLERRGITLAAGALATALADAAAAAPLPAMLTVKTVQAATLAAAGKLVAGGSLTARAIVLAEEALRGMVVGSKLAGLVLAVGVVVGGIGWAGYRTSAETARMDQAAVSRDGQRSADSVPRRAVAVDQYGDALPEGAVARLGAQRFRAFAPALAYMPDGKTLIGKTTHEIIFWDAATGKEQRRLPVGGSQSYYGYPEYTMDVSPDGTMLAFDETTPGDKKAKVSLRELPSGKKIRFLSIPREKDENRFFWDMRFTPDGKSLIASYLGKVVVFDMALGRARLTVNTTAYRVYSVAVSPDSKLMAAGLEFSQPGANDVTYSVHLFDMTTGKLLRTIDELPNNYWRPVPAFAPDGKMLAVGISNGALLLDSQTGKELGRLESKIDAVRRLAFTPDSKKLVCAGRGWAVVWDVMKRSILHTLPGRSIEGGYVALSPDGKTVALGTEGGIVRIWDLDTGKERFADYDSHDFAVRTLAFSPDGKTLASAEGLEPIILWSTADWQRCGGIPVAASEFSFSPDGKRLAAEDNTVGEGASKIRVWDFVRKNVSSTITFPAESLVYSAVFSPDGRKLITLESDNHGPNAPRDRLKQCVRQWNVASGRQDQVWVIPEGVGARTVTSDGKMTAGDIGPGGFIVFDMAAGKEKLRGGEFQKWNRVNISPDARVLASWDSQSPYEGQWPSSDVRLWEITTGKEVFHLKGREKLATPAVAAWSADGGLLAIGENESREAHTVRLWDAAAGKELRRFAGLKEGITALAFSPDASFLACGLGNGTILILNATKGRTAITTKRSPDLWASCWADLAADDAPQAHRAIGTLVGNSKQSVPFLGVRLKAVAAFDADRIHKWIAELDSDIFAVRQAAAKRLEAVGGQIQPHIQKALKAGISLEARRRLEQILTSVTATPSRETLRTIRAIMVLERIGSLEAKAVLETLARGAPGARETEEAKASLERLNARTVALH